MNLVLDHAVFDACSSSLERTANLIDVASMTVSPLWPLESPIAVNPLAGFEDMPFPDAVSNAAELFDARAGLPLKHWRALLNQGRVSEVVLSRIAVERLGGPSTAFQFIAPDVTAYDLLMKRLVEMEETTPANDGPPELTPGEALIAKWCAAFFDRGFAAEPMPGREKGLYSAVHDLLADDPQFYALNPAEAGFAWGQAPLDAIRAVHAVLGTFQDGEAGGLRWMRRMIARLPGWAGHIRWRSEKADLDVSAQSPATITDLLALWALIDPLDPQPSSTAEITYGVQEAAEQAFGLRAGTLEALTGRERDMADFVLRMTNADLAYLFMSAAERGYEEELIGELRKGAVRPEVQPQRAAAQLVFCIDVRSEPIRRAVERQGSYQTFGYAGFFGLPIALQSPVQAPRRRQLPVLLEPKHDLRTVPSPGREREAHRLLQRVREDDAMRSLTGTAKLGAATSFAAAEAAGPLGALMLAARSCAPRFAKRLALSQPDRLDAVLTPYTGGAGEYALPLQDKLAYAQGMFALTGMESERLARIVVLTGHGASAVNNPFMGALECGACGGRAGGPNARALSQILNRPEVRSQLHSAGTVIPPDTIFIAAQHDTTTDEIVLFDEHLVPESYQDELHALKCDLQRAAAENRSNRAAKLGRSAKDVLTAAAHWGEVRPEWGLAGNAAFLAAPRALTEEADLGGRVFLHSYDWRKDADGAALRTILTAPMIVAQWINCQYLFSTMDNARYGAGDKTTHNVVGGFGVVQGNEGDLCVGLPKQSLFCDDGTPYHIPQRLLTVILAPVERVDTIIMDTPILSRLFGNGWVKLIVIDPTDNRCHRWIAGDTIMPASSAPGGWAQRHHTI
ncbi:putative inorganic carbon transporter subunit DabA [Novosphingobium sp. 9U]|uniref:putative inorganic carbon transporter subunit DabA n=1 Tax=Novosphingobium sp. 9U TaxID=2653158 RepID=UPI0012F0F212|nr:putative inorganic carbon transporter subunit DabA [Novosphingobium sp. 9U]VWX48325.1 conserved hypothetical protein [Novosphingobium sp. 9U]